VELIKLEKAQKTRVFYAMCLAAAAIMVVTGKQEDPAVIASAVVLALASLYPFYLWLLGDARGLPLWPVFAAFNGLTAALPMVQSPASLDAYTPADVVTGGLTYTGFLVLGTVCWLAAVPRFSRPPRQLLMISGPNTNRVLFVFVGLGIFYYLNAYFWWIPFPGNTLQITRGICLSLNTMGIFVLCFYLGRGLLTKLEGWLTVVLSALSAMFMATTLIINTAIVPIGLGFLGYVLGSGKMPWKALAVTFVAVSVLHAGKFTMRSHYWGGTASHSPLELLSFYGEWSGYGLEQLGGSFGIAETKNEDGSEVTSVFERAGTLHMLLRVQKMSPQEVPFLGGITYEPIPYLLVPRFINSEKGIPHAANIMLTVNYGVQSSEVAAGGTSIMWGLVAEAYANFGYLGVAGLAVALALFYAAFTAMTVNVPMTSLRFVLGLLVMGAAIKADTMALFVTQQFQGILAVAFAAVFLMRRHPNPFFQGQQGVGEVAAFPPRPTSGRAAGAGSKQSSGQEAPGPDMDGMPAPGVLADLIEGHAENVSVEVGTAKRTRVAADGGLVRTISARLPKRVASWMPRSMKRQVVAANRHAAEQTEAALADQTLKDDGATARGAGKRPRQVAVPIQPYYYRSRKA